jgi:glucose-1-phosphate thymidylyltransferase
MLAGIRDVQIITAPPDREQFERLLEDGHQWGMQVSYEVQLEPRGVADALLLAERFIEGERAALILGDNIFFGHGLTKLLRHATTRERGATIFGYWVSDPRQFGVVEFDSNGRAISLEEKPAVPRSNYAVPGLYFYDERAVEYARQLKPSSRGELEISDLNRLYLSRGELDVLRLERSFAWLDAGTPDSLLDAANYIGTIERRQGLKIGCVEEVAWRVGLIDSAQVLKLAGRAGSSSYGDYLRWILDQPR